MAPKKNSESSSDSNLPDESKDDSLSSAEWFTLMERRRKEERWRLMQQERKEMRKKGNQTESDS